MIMRLSTGGLVSLLLCVVLSRHWLHPGRSPPAEGRSAPFCRQHWDGPRRQLERVGPWVQRLNARASSLPAAWALEEVLSFLHPDVLREVHLELPGHEKTFPDAALFKVRRVVAPGASRRPSHRPGARVSMPLRQRG